MRAHRACLRVGSQCIAADVGLQCEALLMHRWGSAARAGLPRPRQAKHAHARIAKTLSAFDTHAAMWYDYKGKGSWHVTASPNCSFLLSEPGLSKFRRLLCPPVTDSAVAVQKARMEISYRAPMDAAAVIQRDCLRALLRCMELSTTLEQWQKGNVPQHISTLRGKVAFFGDMPGFGSRGKGTKGARSAQVCELVERRAWVPSPPPQPPPPPPPPPPDGADSGAADSGAARQYMAFEAFMHHLCNTNVAQLAVPYALAALGILLEWHNPNHFDVDTPSQDLEDLWGRMRRSKKFAPLRLAAANDSDEEEQVSAEGCFSAADRQLILNGILFPVWKMKGCLYNAHALGSSDDVVDVRGRPRPGATIKNHNADVPAYKPFMAFCKVKRTEERFQGTWGGVGAPVAACHQP